MTDALPKRPAAKRRMRRRESRENRLVRRACYVLRWTSEVTDTGLGTSDAMLSPCARAVAFIVLLGWTSAGSSAEVLEADLTPDQIVRVDRSIFESHYGSTELPLRVHAKWTTAESKSLAVAQEQFITAGDSRARGLHASEPRTFASGRVKIIPDYNCSSLQQIDKVTFKISPGQTKCIKLKFYDFDRVGVFDNTIKFTDESGNALSKPLPIKVEVGDPWYFPAAVMVLAALIASWVPWLRPRRIRLARFRHARLGGRLAELQYGAVGNRRSEIDEAQRRLDEALSEYERGEFGRAEASFAEAENGLEALEGKAAELHSALVKKLAKLKHGIAALAMAPQAGPRRQALQHLHRDAADIDDMLAAGQLDQADQKLRDADRSCDALSRSISVRREPGPSIEIVGRPKGIAVPGLLVRFTLRDRHNNPAEGSVDWNFGDGRRSGDVESECSHRYRLPGIYRITASPRRRPEEGAATQIFVVPGPADWLDMAFHRALPLSGWSIFCAAAIASVPLGLLLLYGRTFGTPWDYMAVAAWAAGATWLTRLAAGLYRRSIAL